MFEHKNWMKMLNSKSLTCAEKYQYALRIERARLPWDGLYTSGWVTLTERNWYRPVLYYLVVMDCDSELENAFGKIEDPVGIEVEAELLADEQHISFEKQGVIGEDIFLICIFLCIIGQSIRSV